MNGHSEKALKEHFENISISNAKIILKKNQKLPALRYAVEHIETVGNHCLSILKLFELTQEKEYIKLGMKFLEESARKNGKAYCWGFSNAVSDIPPDADDTAIALLVFLLAKKLKISYLERFLNNESFKQFDSLVCENGGVFTYFGEPRRNDVDPIANTIVAFLHEFSNRQTKARVAIRKYLNEYLEKRKKFHSEYYNDEEYFLLRCAKLDSIFPYYFSEKAKKRIKKARIFEQDKKWHERNFYRIRKNNY